MITEHRALTVAAAKAHFLVIEEVPQVLDPESIPQADNGVECCIAYGLYAGLKS